MNRDRILAPALAFIGKENFRIDPAVPNGYLVKLCVRQVLSIIRGVIKSTGLGSPTRRLLLGRGVKLRCKSKLCLGSNVRLQDGVTIDALSRDGVTIGDRSMLGVNSLIECTGTLRSLGKGVRIGHDSTFGADCYFGAAGGIEVGNFVIAGQRVRFHSENHVFSDVDVLIREQGVSHKGISVGNNVWIGAGAVFLDGANVGDGCVVAANAVVTARSWPPNSVIGGVPAKIIASRGSAKDDGKATRQFDSI